MELTLKSKTGLKNPHPYWFFFSVSVKEQNGVWYCQDNMLSRVGIASGSTAEEAISNYKTKYSAFELHESNLKGLKHNT
jgi:hypothetical protein